MNNKGQIGDIVFIMVTLTSIALTMILAKYVYDKIGVAITGSTLATAESTAAYNSFNTAFVTFNGLFAWIIMGLTCILLITSFLVRSHPVFVIINIVGCAFLIFLGMIFSNIYYDVASTPDLINISTSTFSTTTFIMLRMPWIAVFMTFLVSIVMFIKGDAGQGPYG